MTEPWPLAMIGCGAIADNYYFPAIERIEGLKTRMWLVDPSEKGRAQAISKFGFVPSQQAARAEDLPPSVRAVINATPSNLHFVTTMPLLERGVSVLLEKPVAESYEEGAKMVDAARGRCVFSVNQFRRLMPAYKAVGEYIASGKLGDVKKITWFEGGKFEWPTQSGFYFRRPWNGRPRGASLDVGAHIIDLVCHWLGEAPSVKSAVMDSAGGPETVLRAELATPKTVIDVRISFLAKMANAYSVEGTKGSIRGQTSELGRFDFKEGNGPWRSIMIPGTAEKIAVGKGLIEDFIKAVDGTGPAPIEAATVLPSLKAIDELYAVAVDELPECYKEWVA